MDDHSIKRMTLEAFLAEFKRRAATVGKNNVKFVCPMCKTPQSLQDFIDNGVSEEEAKNTLGFSCVGRVTGAKGPRNKPDGKPCDWSLGGLFKMHTLEIETPDDGKLHPHFEFAKEDQ